MSTWVSGPSASDKEWTELSDSGSTSPIPENTEVSEAKAKIITAIKDLFQYDQYDEWRCLRLADASSGYAKNLEIMEWKFDKGALDLSFSGIQTWNVFSASSGSGYLGIAGNHCTGSGGSSGVYYPLSFTVAMTAQNGIYYSRIDSWLWYTFSTRSIRCFAR